MKCPGAETLLRAVINCDEGVRAAIRRQEWLNAQDAAYLQELAESCSVLMRMADKALASKRRMTADAQVH